MVVVAPNGHRRAHDQRRAPNLRASFKPRDNGTGTGVQHIEAVVMAAHKDMPGKIFFSENAQVLLAVLRNCAPGFYATRQFAPPEGLPVAVSAQTTNPECEPAITTVWLRRRKPHLCGQHIPLVGENKRAGIHAFPEREAPFNSKRFSEISYQAIC